MDSSEQNQSCAICLESLLLDDTTTTSALPCSATIGAVVPCGHVFHRSCWGRWFSANQRRHAATSLGRSGDGQDVPKCKCPMCNAPCDNFVQLFMGGEATSGPKSGSSPATTTTATSSLLFVSEEDSSNESIVMLTQTCHDSAKRLDRVKEKLNRYKKENKTLETKLEEERRHREETMERAVERHSKERRSWKRQQVRMRDELTAKREAMALLQEEVVRKKQEHERERLKWDAQVRTLEQKLVQEVVHKAVQDRANFQKWEEERAAMRTELEATKRENEIMRQEIDRTIEMHVEERRCREKQTKELQQTLDKAREDGLKAEARVQKAIHGIAQMRVYHEIRKDQMKQCTQEKAKPQDEVREMKALAHPEEEVVFERR